MVQHVPTRQKRTLSFGPVWKRVGQEKDCVVVCQECRQPPWAQQYRGNSGCWGGLPVPCAKAHHETLKELELLESGAIGCSFSPIELDPGECNLLDVYRNIFEEIILLDHQYGATLRKAGPIQPETSDPRCFLVRLQPQLHTAYCNEAGEAVLSTSLQFNS